jgi:hypothetical protein
MLGIKFVRLIETHSEVLSRGLVHEIHKSERTSDFRKIAPDELQRAARDLYYNLGDWLLKKTDSDIAIRFRGIAARRAAAGVRLHQLIWALTLTRDHLWHYLQREAFADTVIELHGELELQASLNQFFDRAIYHAIEGYEEAAHLLADRRDRVQPRESAASASQ